MVRWFRRLTCVLQGGCGMVSAGFRFLVIGLAFLLVGFLQSLPNVRAVITPPWDPFFASQTAIAQIPPTVLLNPAPRPFGVAVGDFDEDGYTDAVIGRVDGRIFF